VGAVDAAFRRSWSNFLARFGGILSKAPSHRTGLKCLRSVRLGDFIFDERLAVAILTAASGAQKFPAVGDIALDEFLNLFDMGGADNLVVGELLHGRGGYQQVARSAIAKAQIQRRVEGVAASRGCQIEGGSVDG
jgi:hypothetical protein